MFSEEIQTSDRKYAGNVDGCIRSASCVHSLVFLDRDVEIHGVMFQVFKLLWIDFKLWRAMAAGVLRCRQPLFSKKEAPAGQQKQHVRPDNRMRRLFHHSYP